MPASATPTSETPTLAQLTTIGVGGSVDRFVEPKSEGEFIAAVRDADAANLPLLVIGGGSNLLVGDEPFRGVVVRDKRHGISVLDGVDATDIDAADSVTNNVHSESDVAEGGNVNESIADTKAIDSLIDMVETSDKGLVGTAETSCTTEASDIVEIVADAGANWDDFVAFCVASGFSGVEGLSGVPGSVGASVVQNIGAYGQEVASSVSSVRVFDRESDRICRLDPNDMHFGYRSSALKSSMYSAPAMPASRYFPTPRYVVLSVTFTLKRNETGEVAFGQLAKALGVEVGERMPIAAIREAVLKVRALKGMLEDPSRYASRWMQGCKDEHNLAKAVGTDKQTELGGNSKSDMRNMLNAQSMPDGHGSAEVSAVQDDADVKGRAESKPNFDRHSCGSFFMNPILGQQQAAKLPVDAPRFAATLPDGKPGVKTSAAWLIDHAGFHKGYKVSPDAKAGLSTLHTLALTNRGGAQASDISELARAVQNGVEAEFGIRLVPEPVVVGIDLR
ncbi:FAD-binding protein [Bifidobacterium sp. ESL0728]|nr:FAD-binding protein [Bifidobacterium sp. ESL0728]WEV59921.1 FAD-binding protein [Bifidobacterium sp. ESL0728]